MASEQFSLCWDNFHKNMSSGMQSLLDNEHLVDVTLAVEGRQLKAHKMVLSVCSPYFRDLFRSNPCQHPIVFMKDVSYVAISDLLQFMYQGEVQVAQENLSTFIKTAEALQIKGLTADGALDNDDSESTELERPVVESSTKRSYDSTSKPIPATKLRKPAGPASKRHKFAPSTDGSSTVVTVSAPAVVNKSDGIVTPITEVIQFKIDPENTNQTDSELLDESQEPYGDDTTIDDVQDDTDDYGLMETTDDEPKAGTSADGAGEGQGTLYFIKGARNPKLILNGYDFICERQQNSKTFWRCSFYTKMKCRTRVVTSPVGVQLNRVLHCHDPNPKLGNLRDEDLRAVHVNFIQKKLSF